MSNSEKNALAKFLRLKDRECGGCLTDEERYILVQVERQKNVLYKSKYPPRTEQARREAQYVARIMDLAGIKKDQSPSVTVIVHKDNTVSVGISGVSGYHKTVKTAKLLQDMLGDRYTVSAYSIPTDNIEKKGEGRDPGVCFEPKAANAACRNHSPITGMDTVWRGKKNENRHPYKGVNVGGAVDTEYEQMEPCDTCGHDNNIREYMKYANSNKDKR